jgi:hypothetical protein
MPTSTKRHCCSRRFESRGLGKQEPRFCAARCDSPACNSDLKLRLFPPDPTTKVAPPPCPPISSRGQFIWRGFSKSSSEDHGSTLSALDPCHHSHRISNLLASVPQSSSSTDAIVPYPMLSFVPSQYDTMGDQALRPPVDHPRL